ncbi:Uncharacterized protein APZ42_003703 [Daphnia magna]|uniref:Uncharacterized protein n=1 Tax=Daphnia magna TaxID=35525 RepID=A0A162C255_9CRUS|nr:Uncharacterized protein APZ42_003703 [Daphnia magna]
MKKFLIISIMTIKKRNKFFVKTPWKCSVGRTRLLVCCTYF